MAVRVFLDTNVWLSAVVFSGLCAEILLELDARGHQLLTSVLLREEVHAVMQRKFPRQATAVERFDALWADATRVPDVVEPADDADTRLVAATGAAGADIFITRDPRVLNRDPRGEMGILSPRLTWQRAVTPTP